MRYSVACRCAARSRSCVGVGQRLRALGHALLQRLLPHLALQRVEHVPGHEGQHVLVAFGIAAPRLVALHRQRAQRLAAAQQRHAHEVRRRRAHRLPAVEPQLPRHLPRRPAHGPGVANQRQRDRVGQFLGGELLVRPVHLAVHLVDEVDEAQPLPALVVQRDVEVRRVHQLADDAVQPLQQAGHVALRGGRVGDVEQRALQPLGLLQALDRRLQLLHAPQQRPGGRRTWRRLAPRIIVLLAVHGVAAVPPRRRAYQRFFRWRPVYRATLARR